MLSGLAVAYGFTRAALPLLIKPLDVGVTEKKNEFVSCAAFPALILVAISQAPSKPPGIVCCSTASRDSTKQCRSWPLVFAAGFAQFLLQGASSSLMMNWSVTLARLQLNMAFETLGV